jgi:hypothetical protein
MTISKKAKRPKKKISTPTKAVILGSVLTVVEIAKGVWDIFKSRK